MTIGTVLCRCVCATLNARQTLRFTDRAETAASVLGGMCVCRAHCRAVTQSQRCIADVNANP